jgi:hypothetical protein
VEEQIAVLVCVRQGVLDDIPLQGVGQTEEIIRRGDRLSDEDTTQIVDLCLEALAEAGAPGQS